jgi:hypothetical protein
VINSFDGGNTWSRPAQLYNTLDPNGRQEGVAPVRIISDEKNRLHVTWTRFDERGNGNAIFYSQSQDLGQTWSKPFLVAEWRPGWYEVDWLSAGVIDDEIHLIWEGSNREAALNERISYDGGRTWEIPDRILPNLVGENGFASLITDITDQLHLLVVLRGDAGYATHGVWYTTWGEGGWMDPVLVGTDYDDLYNIMGQLQGAELEQMMKGTLTGNGLRYQKAAILNGNELFMVVVNEYDGEIWSSHTILPAPYIPPVPYVQPTDTPTANPTPFMEVTETPAPVSQIQLSQAPMEQYGNPGRTVLIALLPVVLLTIGLFIFIYISNRFHT